MNAVFRAGGGRVVERARRVWLVLHTRRMLGRLRAPVAERDPAHAILFFGSFAVYLTIGGFIHRFGGLQRWNVFFNADCPRVLLDMTRSHVEAPSGNVSIAHPLFPLLTHPPTFALGLVLGESYELAARLLCHAAAAGGNVAAYSVFRRLGAGRTLALGGAVTLALSTSQVVNGSIVETFSFVSLVLAGAYLVSLRSTRVLPNVLVHVAAFGINVALAPHALLCAPLAWLPRLSFRRWARNAALFIAALVALTLVLAKAQEQLYPGAGFFFQRNAAESYSGYWSVPKTRRAIVRRARRLIPHFTAFSVVAPRPFLTDAPDHITTFMWEQKDAVARYEPIGGFSAAILCVLGIIATVANAFGLYSGDGKRRATIVYLAGWLAGTFGLFLAFGDDLLLFSPFWTFHQIAWTVIGLAATFERRPRWRRWLVLAGVVFLVTLVAANATFVRRMLGHYS